MKSSSLTSMSAGLLLIALIGQAGAFKLVKQPAAVVPQAQPTVQQQEETIQREQFQQQRQFEFLQQQQHQAEYQIQQQQLEAQRLIGQPLLAAPQQQQRQEVASGVKGAPAPPSLPPATYYERQQYAPARSTIAYLVVRPPYPALLPYDDSAYRSYLPSLAQSQAYPAEYPKQAPVEAYGPAATKGGRQEGVPPPPPPQPPVDQPQPALVVPVHGDKHGKLRAMLDKIMSKLSFSSYEVAGEEYVYPAPSAASVKHDAPIVQQQQPIEQQQIQQVREEEPQPTPIQQQPIQQQPIQQQPIQQQPNQQQPIQQQQQQVSVQEQDRDQGFDEPVKSPAAAQR